MKLLVRLTILGLAAVGARTLYERLRPRVSGATGAGNVMSETITPAFREAASSVRNASTHAVHEVAGAAKDAAQDLKDAASGAADTGRASASGSAGASPSGPGSGTAAGAFGEPAPHEHDHQLSSMAAHDLGIDEDSRS